jgi:hypothetical protein
MMKFPVSISKLINRVKITSLFPLTENYILRTNFPATEHSEVFFMMPYLFADVARQSEHGAP